MARAKAIDFQVLFEHLPDAIVVLDRELRCVECNSAYLRTCRVRREDVIGRRMLDAFPNDPDNPDNPSARRLRASLEKVLATRTTDVLAYIPYHVPREDGQPGLELRLWSATHTPLLDEDGEVAWIIQNTTDVTDLDRIARSGEIQAAVLGRARSVEQGASRLGGELQRLRGFVDQAPGLIAVVRGRSHTLELANRVLREAAGPAEVLGRSLLEVFPEIVAQGVSAELDRAFDTGRVYVNHALRVERPVGRERFFDIVFQPIFEADGGGVAGLYIQGHEITRQVQLANERRVFLELVPVILWTARSDGALTYVNDRGLRYTGKPREKILEKEWVDVIAEADRERVLARWAETVATGSAYEMQYRMRRADGVYRWQLARAVPIVDGAGHVTRWLGANMDVDDDRRAREDLEERAAYEERLIGIVSHDLRNPLNVISIATQLLLDSDIDGPRLATLVRIEAAAARASRLVRDFMDLAQARSGRGIPIRSAWTDLGSVAQEVVEELRVTHPGREIRISQRSGELACWCDEDRIAQVIANLVSNGLQYGAPDAPVTVALRSVAGEIEAAVHNAGPPIPPDERDRLFFPFWRGRRDTRGLGLGLYIAHEIVAAHGGRLTVSSTAAEGTTFTVVLPRGLVESREIHAH